MGTYFSRPPDETNNLFPSRDKNYFADNFSMAGRRYPADKMQNQFLFGRQEDLIHIGKKAFPYSNPFPTEDEPLTTVRASVYIRNDSLKLEKCLDEDDEPDARDRLLGGQRRQNFAQYYSQHPQQFICKFNADVPCTVYLYQWTTEILKDRRLTFSGQPLACKTYTEPGENLEFESGKAIDHVRLAKEQKSPTDDGKFPLVLHIVADESYHPYHSHAAYILVDSREGLASGDATKYTLKLERIKQANDGVVYLMQEIYGINPTDRSVGTGGGDNAIERDSTCIICMQNPMDTMSLPCRHLFCCWECVTSVKDGNHPCPLCRQPCSLLLQINFLQKKSDENRDLPIDNTKQKAFLNVPSDMVPVPLGAVVCPPAADDPSRNATGCGISPGSFTGHSQPQPTLNLYDDYNSTMGSTKQPRGIYDVEHDKETILRPHQSGMRGRALPKCPPSESAYATPESSHIGVYQTTGRPTELIQQGEVHMSNPSASNTPVQPHRQMKGMHKSSKKQHNSPSPASIVQDENYPPPPADFLTSRDDDEAEERGTLNMSHQGTHSHRAAHPYGGMSTTERVTHRSDVYDSAAAVAAANRSPKAVNTVQKQASQATDSYNTISEYPKFQTGISIQSLPRGQKGLPIPPMSQSSLSRAKPSSERLPTSLQTAASIDQSNESLYEKMSFDGISEQASTSALPTVSSPKLDRDVPGGRPGGSLEGSVEVDSQYESPSTIGGSQQSVNSTSSSPFVGIVGFQGTPQKSAPSSHSKSRSEVEAKPTGREYSAAVQSPSSTLGKQKPPPPAGGHYMNLSSAMSSRDNLGGTLGKGSGGGVGPAPPPVPARGTSMSAQQAAAAAKSGRR